MAFSLSGTPGYPEAAAWRRSSVLALVAGLHVLALVWWPSVPREADSPVRRVVGQMIYLTPPAGIAACVAVAGPEPACHGVSIFARWTN